MNDELKSCPFCGGEAIGFEWSDDDEVDEGERHADDAYCAVKANHKDDCLLKVGEFYMWIAATEEEAAEIWNKRAERTCHREEDQNNWGTMYDDWCSECDEHIKQGANYCPGCGAKVVDDE